MTKYFITKSILPITIFCLGVFTTSLLYNFIDKDRNDEETATRNFRTQKGELTNPLLECEITNGITLKEPVNFKHKVENYVNQLKQNENILDISLLFRQMNDGLWFGIQEKEPYIPSSLLKVPVIMSYFKKAEENPKILEEKLTLIKKYDLYKTRGKIQFIEPKEEIKEGETYTILELMERSILFSDNQAALLLKDNIIRFNIPDIYADLDYDNDLIFNLDGTISVKSYTRFFRILFNASYLNQKYSEKMLLFLTKTEFQNGIRTSVPPHIQVAHKFGEGGNVENIQLHDCGIIYYPRRPYLLCIMTKGKDLNTLVNSIHEISKLIYNEIENQENFLRRK